MKKSTIPDSLNAIFDKDSPRFFLTFQERDLDYKDPSGRSLLINAIMEDMIDVVDFLLEFEIQLKKTDKKGMGPLHYCALDNNLIMASKMLDKGIPINELDKFGNTPLNRAIFEARGEKYEIVKFLIEKGGNPLIKNYYDSGPLDFAMKIGDEYLVDLLRMSKFVTHE